jgi:hypothetical protein
VRSKINKALNIRTALFWDVNAVTAQKMGTSILEECSASTSKVKVENNLYTQQTREAPSNEN